MRCAIAFPCGAHWIDMAGYVASLLVFATFYMKTMIPLRIIAVLSNVAFIVYASSDGLYPILVLHSVLLPLNLSRISQTVELKKLVERATKGDVSVKCLGPFMKPVRWEAGGVIFNRGEHADCLYILAVGKIGLEESNHVLQAGDLFGAIELFSDARQRTQTAWALTDVELLRLTGAELAKACYQNPGLAFHLLRLSANRQLLMEDTQPNRYEPVQRRRVARFEAG
jgi:CRP/FNR family transcriptional regulator, cyclic AMP receptor protein